MKTTAAQQRASVILRVQKGEITATAGARELGISRKTYHAWEKRGLTGLLRSVSEQEPGRPPKQTDPEKAALQRKVAALEAELKAAKEVEAVRLVLLDMAKIRKGKESSKKNSKRSTAS
jgi:transposase